MKKYIVMLLFLSSSFLYAQDQNSNFNWQAWMSKVTNKVNGNQIAQFRGNLPPKVQKHFDSADRATQALAVVIQKGLIAEDPSMSDTYVFAFKIANKAEVGYYMHQVKKRLAY